MPRAPAPLRPEDLLQHAAWLRRLASSLVRGDADAEDLVQETFLAALRSPPLDDRPVRGWLTEVIRNVKRMRAREGARRALREDAIAHAAEGSAPSTEHLLTRLQAQRRLAELVSELDEPLRSTVLLRYFEGLSAAEIARHQGVPAGTVRWRLKAGLDRLREALDQDSGGDRRRWCLLLAPLAARRGVSWTGVLKGIWIMSRAAKVGATIAALLLLVGALAWFRVGSMKGAGPAPSASVAAAQAPRGPRPVASLPRSSPIPLITAKAERDAAAVHGAFEGRVLDWGNGRPVTGAEVTFSIDGAGSIVNTDEDGNFHFEPPKEGRCSIALVTAADYLPFAPEWGHSPLDLVARAGTRVRDLTVYLVPKLDYTGAVVDPEGKPVKGATVILLGAGQGEQALQPVADRFSSNDQGEFVFNAPDYALLEASHPAYGAARARLDGPALTSHRLTIKLRPKAAAEPLGSEKISGRVVDAQGAPIASALVNGRPTDPGNDLLPSAQALSDASGRFTLEGLDPGRYLVIASRAGYAPGVAESVAAGAEDLLLGLRKGGALTGRVLDGSAGAPVPSFTVAVTRRDGPVREVSVAVRSFVDPEGLFTIPDLEPGEYLVRASASSHAPSRPVPAIVPDPPANAAPIELSLTRGGRVSGKVVEADGGAPIEGARVSMESAIDGSLVMPTIANALTNAQGEFELLGLAPGVRSINVGAYQHHIRILGGLRVEDGGTLGPLRIDLRKTKEGEQPQIELVGIGLALLAKDDGLEVQKVIAGGGAAEVGVAEGDIVLSIDGTPVTTLGFDDSIQHIRGPEGTTVHLTVRKGDGAVIELDAPRRRIQG